MKAHLDPSELEEALAFVTKGLRGKKLRERAKALLVFGEKDISVEFNDLSANCSAEVMEPGKYALNPFIFRPFLETFGKRRILIEISRKGIAIGNLQFAHLRIHGRFEKPEEAVEDWSAVLRQALAKRQKRIEENAEWRESNRQLLEDKLSDARHVSFKRTDGGIEYGAAVLKYERGEPGHRKVYVKTKDFQEVWINELEIVSFGKDPEFNV